MNDLKFTAGAFAFVAILAAGWKLLGEKRKAGKYAWGLLIVLMILALYWAFNS